MPSFTITKRYNQKELSNHMIFFLSNKPKCISSFYSMGNWFLVIHLISSGSERCQNPFSRFLLHIPGTMKNNDKKCTKIIAPLINFPLITIIPTHYGSYHSINVPSIIYRQKISWEKSRKKSSWHSLRFFFIPLDLLMYFYSKLSTQSILDFVATEFSTQLENTCFFY